MYCVKCGKEIQEQAQFCTACGTAVPGAHGRSAVADSNANSAPPARVIIVDPKRGGWLALKGFLTAIVLGALGNADPRIESRRLWMAIALGVGAAYIVSNIRKWSR